MTLLFSSRYHRPETWLEPLKAELPGLDCVVWPDVPAPEKVEFALVWAPKKGELRKYPNLKAISSLGAGVEHILADPDLPEGIPVLRIVDDRLTQGICEYVVLHVLRQHRQLDQIREAQAARRWDWRPPADTPRTTVGILGLGHLGSAAGRMLAGFGFRVIGWSRSPKQVPQVESFAGADQLTAFLRLCDHLVCLLPLTAETRGIVNRETLAALPKGAFLINAGRGPHVVDEDLLAALDSGHVAGATLDVFHREPLPAGHPFWSHPKVLVTPHNAADSFPETVVPQIAENIRRALDGRPLLNVVDRDRGY